VSAEEVPLPLGGSAASAEATTTPRHIRAPPNDSTGALTLRLPTGVMGVAAAGVGSWVVGDETGVGVLSALPDRLGRRYEVQRLLGRGGMADVYAARDTVLGRAVAVKVLRDTANRDRFESEARTLAGLAHPGLVTVLDAGITDDQPWLVMELIDGATLADCCSGVALDPQRVAALGAKLADALSYVHASGFVHRDVKPGNVLLAGDGRVLLADFGIARLVEGAPTVTDTGFTVGTAAYLAPEQVRGEPVTPAADVYSLGLVLLEALTGERAYPGATAEAAVARLTRPPAVPPTLPRDWQNLLAAMTALDPARRLSPAQLAGALRGLAHGMDAPSTTIALRGMQPSTRLLTDPLARQVPPVAAQDGHHDRPSVAERAAQTVAVTARAGGRLLWVAGATIGVLLIVAVLVFSGHGTPKPAPQNTGVPAQVSTDLQRLHDAVNGR
jgi:predicted Ser/Thr protein kinase